MKRVGFIIPAVNRIVEDEMLSYLPPGVRGHVTRLRMTGPQEKPLDTLAPAVTEASAALVDAGCEVVVFHCTANSTADGLVGEQRLLAAVRDGGAPHATSTATALRHALEALRARSLALVTPYSPRARPGAPVSVPISWDELDDPDLRPDRFTIHDVPARLAEVGDLFAGVLDHDQHLPKLS